MLFSSMTFIYVFLPILCVIYLLSKKELRNSILLIASLIFYAWGEPKYLAIMILSIVINYFGAVLIDKYRTKFDKLILISTIILNLGNLIYFKYFKFLAGYINDLFLTNISIVKIIMPIGISLYTLQALSYVIDVYRKDCEVQKNIYKLALYITMFPQLIAGPIIKYHDIEEQIESREVNFDKVSLGVKRFIIGLSKNVLIANTMGVIADKIFTQDPHTFSHLIAWLGAVAYSFQIFFQFSGYADMAIGLGLIFGFKFMENFNYPYISKSITEFWRRWFISLTTWFKQYVYIPLGGNKNGMAKTMRNLGIVFLLTGIWHGANWTFMLWGIWHGFFIIVEKYFKLKEFESKQHSLTENIMAHVYCILVFVLGWVLFRSDNLLYAWNYILNMFGFLPYRAHAVFNTIAYYVDTTEIIVFIVAILCSMPIFSKMLEVENKKVKILVNIWLLLLFFLSTISIASNTYNPFVYFRF